MRGWQGDRRSFQGTPDVLKNCAPEASLKFHTGARPDDGITNISTVVIDFG
jgi:hypothetical protein